MTTKKPAPKTFKAALAELETISEKFESEELDIESGMKDFERGLQLAQFCKEKLAVLDNQVKEIQEKFDV